MVQAEIGTVLHGLLKKTFRSGRWTQGIMMGSLHAASMCYHEMAEDVFPFLDNNGLQTVILMGLQSGG